MIILVKIMAKGGSIAGTLKGASPGKKIKTLGSIRADCRRDPKKVHTVIRNIIPLLLDKDGEVRLTASKLILEFSKLDAKGVAGEAGRLIDVVGKAYDRKNEDDIINWEPYANALVAMGNISEKYPNVGAKCVYIMMRALKYPIYHPESPRDGLHILYAATIRAIGKFGRVAPHHVKEAIPLVYKALLDSFRFQFWIKPLKNKDEDMKYCASRTLTMVGIVSPTVVVPSVTTAFMDKDKKVIAAARNILAMIAENLQMLFPAVMDALDIDKKKLREYIEGFVVELGEKYPAFMIPQLTYRLEDERKWIRFHCAASLGTLFPNHPQYIPSVIPALIDHLENDKELDVRQTVSDTLNVISKLNVEIYDDYTPKIIAAMSDEYHHVRWRMAQILRHIGKRRPDLVYESIPYLIAGLSDQHEHVQWKCRDALEVINVEKVEYQLTIRSIKVGIELLKKVKEKAKIDLPEYKKMLDDAVALARQYKFKESIQMSMKAKELIEERVPFLADGNMPFPGQMPQGYMQMPGFSPQMQYPQRPGPAPGYFGPPQNINQPLPVDNKNENLEKYRKGLRRALKDGVITEDEEEMLEEMRDLLDITMEDHKKLLAEEMPPPVVEPEIEKEPTTIPILEEMALEIAENVNWEEFDTWEGEDDEEGSGSGGGSNLEEGYTYLLENEDPAKAFEHLTDTLSAGRKGLFITRNHPRKICRKYEVDGASHIWLTKMAGDGNFKPTQLEGIKRYSEEFLKNSPRGLLVIDGLEYLVSHNDFEDVHNLVQFFKDLASVSDTIILISVSPSILKPNELKILEREVDSIL